MLFVSRLRTRVQFEKLNDELFRRSPEASETRQRHKGLGQEDARARAVGSARRRAAQVRGDHGR